MSSPTLGPSLQSPSRGRRAFDLYDSVAYVSVMRPPPSSLLDPVFLTYTLLHGGLETQTTFAKSSSKRVVQIGIVEIDRDVMHPGLHPVVPPFDFGQRGDSWSMVVASVGKGDTLTSRDGNGWSGRFQQLLLTGSLIFKSTLIGMSHAPA
jgi:hypothetical protein